MIQHGTTTTHVTVNAAEIISVFFNEKRGFLGVLSSDVIFFGQNTARETGSFEPATQPKNMSFIHHHSSLPRRSRKMFFSLLFMRDKPEMRFLLKAEENRNKQIDHGRRAVIVGVEDAVAETQLASCPTNARV